MSLQDYDWSTALTRPSKTASSAMLALGSWVILLTIVNLVNGAYSPGFKVLWLGFLSNGALGDIYTAHDGVAIAVDDIVFGILGIAVTAMGVLGMKSAVEGGVAAWFKNLPSTFAGLFSTEHGARKTLADWLIVVGIAFYLAWSVQNNTWVDPGVFAVMIVPVAFGVGLNLLDVAEA
jgi:hypothetical protein|tara:strand:+ start:1752 stop:2282 length:531 start_codon:yes stop_codon:yes gene_type:complete